MKKNYLYNLVSSLTNILFPIMSFPYASRILGPIGIGKVQLALSFAQYFGLIAAFGINIYGIQMIAIHKDNQKHLSKIFSELLSINFISCIIVLFAYVGIVQYFSFFQSNFTLYIYSSIIVIFGFTTIDWLYSGLEEFKIIAIRSVLIKIISLVLLYYFVKIPADFIIYLWIILFSMIGNNLINFLFIRNKISFSLKNLQLKKHLKPLFFIFGTTIAASLYTNLDILLLGFFTNEKSVGLYTSAIKIAKISLPFITALGLLMLPKFSMEATKNNHVAFQKMINQSWHYIIILSVPIVVGLYILASEFVIIFSGLQFIDAITTMQISSILPLLIGIGYFFAFQVLVPMGKNKEMFFAVIIGMIISILLNFILTPSLKEKGAAISSVITEIVVTCMYLFYINRHFNFKYDWLLIIKSFTACIFFIPIVWLIHLLKLNIILSMALCIFLNAISYFLIHFFVYRDLFIRKYYYKFINIINKK
jgi:O-antigen/teichoic acid export membrane protein